MSELVNVLKSMPDLYYFQGAETGEIDSAERALNVVFSPDYREYLAEYGIASANGHELTGICPSKRLNVVDVTLDQKARHSVPGSYYVVEDIYVDDIVVWQSADGNIFQSAPGGSPSKICSSLAEYIQL